MGGRVACRSAVRGKGTGPAGAADANGGTGECGIRFIGGGSFRERRRSCRQRWRLSVWTPTRESFAAIWRQVRPYTMTSINRGFALYNAVHHVLDAGIPGDFVECGVWRGGSAMIIALALLERGVTNRRIMLFDTFEGMTDPVEDDRDLHGVPADRQLEEADDDSLMKARCDLDTVRANMLSTGYVRENIAYIKGDVTKTLPTDRIRKIALLRLDTDFYESTRAELDHLYPLVSPGGVIVVDDYGHWQGARKAVDEFLDEERAAGRAHFLAPLDYTGRLFVKPGGVASSSWTKPRGPRYDYVSPGLVDPGLLETFTHLQSVEPPANIWPYLRVGVPHVWRNDTRAKKKHIGVLSVDEGVVLYNAALPFRGKRALEIGCHLGFSTAHLAFAGVELDVIDPALGMPDHRDAVVHTLETSAPGSSYRLHAGFSPGIVETVFRANGGEPWDFAFIDGLHDGDAPANDAKAVEPLMAATAAVMFHDLACPDVYAGLSHFAEAGWNTRIYETMQIMGIAWRGDYTPPEHVPDPRASIADVEHLAGEIPKDTEFRFS